MNWDTLPLQIIRLVYDSINLASSMIEWLTLHHHEPYRNFHLDDIRLTILKWFKANKHDCLIKILNIVYAWLTLWCKYIHKLTESSKPKTRKIGNLSFHVLNKYFSVPIVCTAQCMDQLRFAFTSFCLIFKLDLIYKFAQRSNAH